MGLPFLSLVLSSLFYSLTLIERRQPQSLLAIVVLISSSTSVRLASRRCCPDLAVDFFVNAGRTMLNVLGQVIAAEGH